MENPFTGVMAERSDLELIAIVTAQRDDYQEEALAAAEAEIAARNLTFERRHEAEVKVRRKEVARAKRASKSLDATWKAFLFCFPGLLTLAAAHKYKMSGHDRKWEDAKRWSLYGLCFYVALMLVTAFVKSITRGR